MSESTYAVYRVVANEAQRFPSGAELDRCGLRSKDGGALIVGDPPHEMNPENAIGVADLADNQTVTAVHASDANQDRAHSPSTGENRS
jgi:hypothetical protein